MKVLVPPEKDSSEAMATVFISSRATEQLAPPPRRRSQATRARPENLPSAEYSRDPHHSPHDGSRDHSRVSSARWPGPLATGAEHTSAAWLDWFSPVSLAAFKGNTQVKAGHLPQARTTLLDAIPATEDKQCTVSFGDLAAVEAVAGNPEAGCDYACRALDQLEVTWCAMGMDRVREVRRALAPHQHEQCRDLDDRLYGWSTTVSALSR